MIAEREILLGSEGLAKLIGLTAQGSYIGQSRHRVAGKEYRLVLVELLVCGGCSVYKIISQLCQHFNSENESYIELIIQHMTTIMLTLL